MTVLDQLTEVLLPAIRDLLRTVEKSPSGMRPQEGWLERVVETDPDTRLTTVSRTVIGERAQMEPDKLAARLLAACAGLAHPVVEVSGGYYGSEAASLVVEGERPSTEAEVLEARQTQLDADAAELALYERLRAKCERS